MMPMQRASSFFVSVVSDFGLAVAKSSNCPLLERLSQAVIVTAALIAHQVSPAEAYVRTVQLQITNHNIPNLQIVG